MPDAAQDRSGIENRSTLIFESGALSLCDIAGCLVLRDGLREIRISSTPFEPCTYLEGTSCRTILHNAFAESDIRRIAARGGTLRSITGTEYDAGRLCGLLAFAAAHLAECGIPCTVIFKQREGRPNITDAIANGQIQLVINTPSADVQSASDGSEIRRAAIRNHIPYMTTMAAAHASAVGIGVVVSGEDSGVNALQDIHARIKKSH
jgi:hypothetical protein